MISYQTKTFKVNDQGHISNSPIAKSIITAWNHDIVSLDYNNYVWHLSTLLVTAMSPGCITDYSCHG